jgi:hypothetical protein
MAYVITLPERELTERHTKFRTDMRFTKAVPRSIRRLPGVGSPPIVLVLGEAGGDDHDRHLRWIGIVARHNPVGAVEGSITVDPFRECFETIPIDGPDGLLRHLGEDLTEEFAGATSNGDIGILGRSLWEGLDRAMRTQDPDMADLLDWLLAQAAQPAFSEDDPADRSWQEQRDAVGCLLRIADFPLPALAAWRRPASPDAPYLSGLIPQPVEQGLLDHDVRVADIAFGMFGNWRSGEPLLRCDIHVLQDAHGRVLEVVNVNNTMIEARTGTDMIYYHEPTMSLVFVQYKRLDSKKRTIQADKRLYDQLDRLDKVATLSRRAIRPSEWRLGGDPCFLKLAHWPQNAGESSAASLAPGMYLPVPYVRLLLEDDCTLGERQGRVLGYGRIERYLVADQFIKLVKHGLVGTVGVTREMLFELISSRVDESQSLVVAVETGPESVSQRETRLRRRGTPDRSYQHREVRSQ